MISYALPQTTPTLTALRGMSPPTLDGYAVYVNGHEASNDDGGGLFSWVAGATNAEDEGLWICPTGYAGTGRFRRVKGSSRLSVLDFGADRSGTVDATYAIYNTFLAAATAHKGVYFPEGTYLVGSAGTAAWLTWPLYSGCDVSGDGIGNTTIKFADNGVQYDTLLSEVGFASGITIHDLTIDQNATNNQSQKIKLLDPTGANFMLVSCIAASCVTVRDCEFLDVYGVNTIQIGGGGSHVTVTGNRLTSSPIGGAWYDNSAIYVDCLDHHVAGNVLTGINTRAVVNGGCSWSVGGIEVHGGPSVVSGNTVLDFLHGCNVVNSAYVDDAIGCESAITGNTFNLCNNGVVIWATANTTHRVCRISNNTMLLNPVIDPIIAANVNILGVGFTPGAYEDFDITDNTIRFLAPSDVVLRESSIAGIGNPFAEASAFSNLNIRGNTITRAPVMGIGLRGTWSNAEISGNTIIDAGVGNCATADHRSAIYADGSPWSQVGVHDNQIKYTGGSAGRCAHAAYLQPTSGSVRNTYSRNKVTAAFSIDENVNGYVTQE